MNSVVLIGRLTRDPEIRYIQSDMAVCTFTLAVDRQYRKDGDQTADFIRIKTFGKQAENCDRYLAKGRQVGVQGRIQTGSYTNKDGQKVYTTDVIAGRVEFLASPNNRQSNQQGSQQSQQQTESRPAPQERQMRYDDLDADLPEGYEYIDEDDILF